MTKLEEVSRMIVRGTMRLRAIVRGVDNELSVLGVDLSRFCADAIDFLTGRRCNIYMHWHPAASHSLA